MGYCPFRYSLAQREPGYVNYGDCYCVSCSCEWWNMEQNKCAIPLLAEKLHPINPIIINVEDFTLNQGKEPK